jgi:Family of unknown function (DUF6314)
MPQLDDFLGAWRLHRRILDRRAGEVGRLTGHAVFRTGAGGAVQEEEGTLTLPNRPPMTATRTYLWSEAPGRLVVQFADGSDFHDFDALAARPEARHLCGDDLYRVRYDFRRWPNWRAVWRVTGPRKDLVIASSLAPLAPGRAPRQNPFGTSTE